jgi:membrane protease YdiL (CAAX protease family)
VEPVEIDTVRTASPQEPATATAIAPAWHTIALVAIIVALSIHSAWRFSAEHGPLNRLYTYGFSAVFDLVMVAWVVVGLRLRRIPLRSLLGAFSFDLRSIALDMGFAAVFWIGSMMVLGSLNLTWTGVEALLAHRTTASHSAQQSGRIPTPGPERMKTLHELAELAPANGREVAAWTLLCLMVGFSEELVFRGYLQRQFNGWARGRIGWGILASAVIFGSAHAYQGVRGMVLITVFGALFSVLAIYRRSLRAGMIAHGWHDLLSGLALAFLRSKHII